MHILQRSEWKLTFFSVCISTIPKLPPAGWLILHSALVNCRGETLRLVLSRETSQVQEFNMLKVQTGTNVPNKDANIQIVKSDNSDL